MTEVIQNLVVNQNKMKENLKDTKGLYKKARSGKIKDFTGRHLNHKTHEGGFHLEATIVSSDFIDMSLIERHRAVYDSMGNMMNNEIHALSMKTLTPDEWEGK